MITIKNKVLDGINMIQIVRIGNTCLHNIVFCVGIVLRYVKKYLNLNIIVGLLLRSNKIACHFLRFICTDYI